MVEKIYGACDCEPDANPSNISIGGKTVEVCCAEWSQKMKERQVSTTAARRG